MHAKNLSKSAKILTFLIYTGIGTRHYSKLRTLNKYNDSNLVNFKCGTYHVQNNSRVGYY